MRIFSIIPTSPFRINKKAFTSLKPAAFSPAGRPAFFFRPRGGNTTGSIIGKLFSLCQESFLSLISFHSKGLRPLFVFDLVFECAIHCSQWPATFLNHLSANEWWARIPWTAKTDQGRLKKRPSCTQMKKEISLCR